MPTTIARARSDLDTLARQILSMDLEAARRQQMDSGYRARTPGYQEFAEQAREDVLPNSAEAASMSGVPILSEAGDAALTVDALRRGNYSEAALGALASAIPILGLGTIKQVLGKADKIAPEQPRNAPRFEAFETARRNAALPIEQGGLGLPQNNTAMDRARAMGFDIEAYHGTTKDIDEFVNSYLGSFASHPSSHLGHYAVADPKITDDFTMQDYWNSASDYGVRPRAGANVLPLLIRGEADETVPNTEFADLLDFWEGEQGSDQYERSARFFADWRDRVNGVVKIDPVSKTDYPELSAETYAIGDPSRVRSRFAAFDPARIAAANLLAGVAPWVIGIPALGALYMGKPTSSEDARL